jgi:hypothetical protein
MSDDPAIPARPVTRTRRRVLEYATILVIMALIVGVAYFQEPIGYYTSMHQWDKAAPGKAVSAFLTAGKRGDQKTADSWMASSDYHPLTRNGHWLGYFVATPAGKLEFDFSELAPVAETQATETEFINRGVGIARVTMPDSKGQPVPYRLEMRNGGWKIVEILGGKVGH